MKRIQVEIGARFGRLTVVKESRQQAKHRRFQCSCDCGETTIVHLSALRSGVTRSCGCLRADTSKRHGCRQTPEYATWTHVIARCSNRNGTSWKNYGGRGITVCQRWRTSFEAFLADMGPKPSSRHSIERRDNDGNYEPSNCKWATMKEQRRNTRCNVWVEYKSGETRLLMDVAAELGIHPDALKKRIDRGSPLARHIARVFKPGIPGPGRAG